MRDVPVAYVVFDLLWLEGHSTLALPYADRRRLLAAAGAGRARAGGRPRTARATARRCWRPARRRASRASWPSAWTRPTSRAAARRPGSRSRTARRRTWWSAAGCRARAGAASTLGALAVGVPRRGGGWCTPARWARGFTEATLAHAPCASSSRCERDDSPFEGRQPPKGTIFVEPRLVAQVRVRGVDPHRHAARARRSRGCATTSTRRRSCGRAERNRACRGVLPARDGYGWAMARAIWSGAISFGLVNIPVKLYSAVSRKTVRFHQLDSEDNTRIQQKRVNPNTGEEVPYEQLVKGYELSPDRYVVITARGARVDRAQEDAHDRHRGLRGDGPDRPDLLRPPLLPGARAPAPTSPTRCCCEALKDTERVAHRARGHPLQGEAWWPSARARAC